MAGSRISSTASVTVDMLSLNVIRSLIDTPYYDTHTNALNATTDSSLTVGTDATTRWEVGDMFDWEDDSTEVQRALTVAATAITVPTDGTNRVGMWGTTVATHSANARIRKFPRFYRLNVEKAVQDSIDSDLWPNLYAVYEEQLTHGSTDWNAVSKWRAVDSAAEFIINALDVPGALYAYQKSDSTPVALLPVRVSDVQFKDTTLASSGRAIYLHSISDADNTIFLHQGRKAGVGDLSAGMARVVELGACARLLEWEAAERLNGKAPQGGDLAPGSRNRSALAFRAAQRAAIESERHLLQNIAPRPPRYHLPRHVPV